MNNSVIQVKQIKSTLAKLEDEIKNLYVETANEHLIDAMKHLGRLEHSVKLAEIHFLKKAP